MSKTILIARPHTFIVSVMKPFLEECGYGTDKLARSSSIAESAEDVLLQLRHAVHAGPEP